MNRTLGIGLILVFLAAGVYTIFSLTTKDKRDPKSNPTGIPGTSIVDTIAVLEGVKNTNGKVVEISQNDSSGVMTIETEVFDISTESPKTIDLEKTKRVIKKIDIAWNSGTVFVGKTAAQIISGDIVRVALKQSVYSPGDLMATSIEYVDIEAQKRESILGNTHELFGNIVAISSKGDGMTISLRSRIVDIKYVEDLMRQDSFVVPYTEKVFTVNINTQTTIEGRERSSLAIGDMVKVVTLENIYNYNTVTARNMLWLESNVKVQ